MERNLKTLFTNVYHGELTEGEHAVTVVDFTFNINDARKIQNPAQVAALENILNVQLTNSVMSVRLIPLNKIADVFANYEPEAFDYFTLVCKTDDNRVISKNLFTKDFAIFLKQTRIQIMGNNTEDINPLDWITGLINKKISIWVTYPTVPTTSGLRRVQNINFCEPLSSEQDAATTEEKPF